MTAPLALPYRVGLFAWAALAILQVVWHGWLFPAESLPPALVLAITVVPLVLPLLAIRNVRRALLWVGILSLFYFCHGISEAWSAPGQRALALVEIALTLVLIGTLGWGARHRSPA
ncbi:DUF2069 domain-containing protein [Dyella solisilvae]|uniref:DUF2069 domain-containing protein n=1 Tax=Dyella solisilvae TaxID=1920168 RepID=A0A370K562_9GAMM|nr:DUF2069 domain-containing protein [Dyella solisilvae]RDI97786.1 DUF2069 domain-containing protein [Dyella solisilvae]